MPKRTSDYAADDFVENDDAPPTTKRNKKAATEDAPSFTNARKLKTKKQPVDQSRKLDDNSDEYWELSSAGTRRVTINEFKGNVMVNLREYYEQGGKKLPGKKGISLPIDQFTALVEVLPQIERVLKQRGESIPRPDYDARDVPPAADRDGDEDEQVEDADEGEEDDKSAGGKNRKKNFDATSEEE